MIMFRGLSPGISHTVFYILHPIHVVLSALVTASMFELHRSGKERRRSNFWLLLVIGYLGSVGIATLSDSVIPFAGEVLLGLPNRGLHLGFIEKWWLVNPLALIGVAFAYFRPTTRFPHAGHVLLSTWASLFHIIMARGESLSWSMYLVVFLFLFVAVWLPCCVSDIAFPLLFVKPRNDDGATGR